MMLITDRDAVTLIDFAIRYACAKLQIPEFGIIEHDELLAAIAVKDAAVHQLLTSFLVSYQAWFDFHKKMDRQGKTRAIECRRNPGIDGTLRPKGRGQRTNRGTSQVDPTTLALRPSKRVLSA